MNTVRTALYVSTAVVALGLGGYLAGLFGPADSERPAAALTTPPTPASTPTTPSAPATPSAPTLDSPAQAPASPQLPAAEAPAQPAPQSPLVPPTFDIVRVEPDGSIVIAGKAAANSSIEIIAGSPVLGSTKAGPEGDFAAVLTEALKPGNYEIVLRATAPDGVVTMSTETAIVSIPETAKGDVLALVEQPGEPSRLITVPEPAPPSGETPPAAGTSATLPAETAAPAAVQEQPAATPPATAEAPATTPEAPAAPSTAETPSAPAPAEAPASPSTAEAPAQPSPQPAPPTQTAPQVAAVDPKPETKEQEAVEPQRLDTVAIEAVEIEGRLIFVAGRATARSTVRVYANDILIGESRASEASRFLIEAERDLPVGDYIIRADMLAADGATVLARAAVPFTREEGEFVAAVAPPAGTAEPDESAPETPAPAVEPQPSETATRPAPPAPEAVTETPATQPAPSSQTAARPATPPAAAEPPAEPALGGDNASGAPAAPSTSSDARPPVPFLQPAEPAVPPGAPAQTAPADVAAAPATETKPATQATPSTDLAPKLQSVKSAVIIRRGDSLWRISRRVYGRGIRYSTIYLANQDQIQDPDRIWPGQVFKVPEKSGEGEAADMSKVGDQATTTSN